MRHVKSPLGCWSLLGPIGYVIIKQWRDYTHLSSSSVVLCPQAGSYVQRRHFSLFSASLFSSLYPSSVSLQSSSIVLGLARIFFPSILPSMMSLSRVSLLKDVSYPFLLPPPYSTNQ